MPRAISRTTTSSSDKPSAAALVARIAADVGAMENPRTPLEEQQRDLIILLLDCVQLDTQLKAEMDERASLLEVKAASEERLVSLPIQIQRSSGANAALNQQLSEIKTATARLDEELVSLANSSAMLVERISADETSLEEQRKVVDCTRKQVDSLAAQRAETAAALTHSKRVAAEISTELEHSQQLVSDLAMQKRDLETRVPLLQSQLVSVRDDLKTTSLTVSNLYAREEMLATGLHESRAELTALKKECKHARGVHALGLGFRLKRSIRGAVPTSHGFTSTRARASVQQLSLNPSCEVK